MKLINFLKIKLSIIALFNLTSCSRILPNNFNGLEGVWASIENGCDGDKFIMIKNNEAYEIDDYGDKRTQEALEIIRRFGKPNEGEMVLKPKSGNIELHFKYDTNNISFENSISYARNHSANDNIKLSYFNLIKCDDDTISDIKNIQNPVNLDEELKIPLRGLSM